MKILISIFWLIIFSKELFFWLWLWQLKEYHLGRFKAHFESQAARKLIFSFWGMRYPKLTKKTIVILVFGIILEFLILFYLLSLPEYLFYFSLLISIILAPIIFSLLILVFQIPTVILIKKTLKRAKKKRSDLKNLLVIGITGSYGKTSTKEFLATILAERFKVLKTKKHINAEIGIGQTILKKLGSEDQVFVAEIGAYQKEKIREVCRMLQPKIGILTGINKQHMSTFGSQENIIKAKFELIESLPEDGIAILNGDNELIVQSLKFKVQSPNLKVKTIKRYSVFKKEDIWAEDVKVEKEFVSFRVRTKDGESVYLKINVLGAQNIGNILAAILVARKLEMSWQEIVRGCQKIKPEQGTMLLKKGIKGIDVIDSSYSTNPDGLLADLDYLKIWPKTAKKVIVMPCLIELGRATIEIHKKIGQKIAKVCSLAIIVTKDRFKEIKEVAAESGLKPENILLLEEPNDIFEKIKSFCQSGDLVLLEGRVPKKLISQLIV